MEKIVLFRVDSHSQTVDLITGVDKSDIENAEKFLRLMQNMRTLSFDIMLLQLEQFRSCYERIKAFGNKTVEYITKGRDVLDVLTAEYEALAAREGNFFANFYLERLWDTYLYNRTQLNNIVGTITNAVTRRKTEKDFQKDLINLCNEMERIVLIDWHYNHIADMETVVFCCNADSVILRGNGVNQMFRVTAGTLLPLLYEYSYNVENMGLSVFECAYCHKHYLNTSDNVCCNDEKCREQKIKDFRTKSKDEFSGIKKTYCTYIRGLKHKLTATHKSEYAIDLFTDAQKKAESNVSAKIDEYKDGGLKPDADLDIMIDTVREKMKKFTDKLLKMSDYEIERIYNDKMNGELAFGIETLK